MKQINYILIYIRKKKKQIQHNSIIKLKVYYLIIAKLVKILAQ
jgi:hypothetical protein